MENETPLSRRVLSKERRKRGLFRNIAIFLSFVLILSVVGLFLTFAKINSNNSKQKEQNSEIQKLNNTLKELDKKNSELDKKFAELEKKYNNVSFDKCLLSVRGGNGKCGKHKLTYYNLNMSVFGAYYVDKYGFKRRKSDKKIMVACAIKYRHKSLVKGTICVDTGGFAKRNPEQIDIATNW